ncbi:DUF397 domain-containing protein [Microbispora sp. RL4-1S]|uniref:DUF397 domain-containing protein n=1 Tax=Microbispora oryzae TaxID=2806554 RepID=A0A940WPH9_9ACTN|nr:DUF397 domain-containing protein [Microbispora oryzae]MBP2705150.1 DUF397 domain-containing protein [Microbispora oryzae]
MESPQGLTTSTLKWRRSSRCTGGNCVQVAFASDVVALRDSKNPEAGVLVYTREQWREFVESVKAGAHSGGE